MRAVTVIFPHQLFPDHPAINSERDVYLVEEELFFNQYNFHKQKLVLHRATMKMYEELLQSKKLQVHYIEAKNNLADVRQLVKWLSNEGVNELHYADTVDNWLERRIASACRKATVNTIKYSSPNFYNTMSDVQDFFADKKKYLQTDFYVWQRKQLNILLDSSNQPEGGKWTYDIQNRIKFPKAELPPEVSLPGENKYVREARRYVLKNFHKNQGSIAPAMEKEGNEMKEKDDHTYEAAGAFYPTTYEEAETWLDDFLATRFQKFGIYQDAMVGKAHYLHHSVLTPMLNIGLLQPRQIVTRAMEAASKYDIPINSLEGFIRQIIGWREFIRIVYERDGSRQRTRNFWGFTRKIPDSFRTGNTGIVPVDSVIKKLIHTGYSHHIERLMVMANFMLLCEFNPDEVYQWFMEMYVDSYDWVMVPNVYGMTQFADGGLMATKPYISGSNYIMKMSDYKKGEWQQVWDGLFWRFMHVNRDYFSKNKRLALLLNTFDKMPAEKKEAHLKRAESYLAELDNPAGGKASLS